MPSTKPVSPAGVQEIPIKPLVVQLPGERIIERYFQPVERQTEPLPVVPQVHIEVPTQPAPHITVNVPERSKDESERVRGNDTPTHGTPYPEKERGSAPTPEVPHAKEVPRTPPPMEVGSSTQPEVKVPEGTSPEPSGEEKSSPEKKKVPRKLPPSVDIGTSGDKMKVYSGKGRRHTDDEIDDILDEYLQYGNLPQYVTERQRRDYRKHKRLEVRRLYLERAGLIKTL